VRFAYRHCFWQDDVHFNEVLAAEVERFDVIDEDDAIIMIQYHPRQHVDELTGRSEAGQHPDLICLYYTQFHYRPI